MMHKSPIFGGYSPLDEKASIKNLFQAKMAEISKKVMTNKTAREGKINSPISTKAACKRLNEHRLNDHFPASKMKNKTFDV